ncbi:hypothetical protein [Streptomyces sp. NPDC053367]|uniref:hypothetical protein n=1 Tax=Streptomyces sp. NPDC053367 TaxID=3365700 RepID=UPI0037D70085
MSNPEVTPPGATGWEHAEFYGWSGTWQEVARRLFAVPAGLLAHPRVALLLQGEGRADVRLFQRAVPGADEVGTLEWTGEDLDGLPERLAGLLCGNSAAGGLRQAIRTTVAELTPFVDLGSTPAPATARGAFGHPLRHYPEDGRLSAYLLTVPVRSPGGPLPVFAKGPKQYPGWEWYSVTAARRDAAGVLFGLPREIAGRDRYALFLQIRDEAEIHLFERPAPQSEEIAVRVWRGPRLGDLPGRCLRALAAAGRSPSAGGEAVRDVLAEAGVWTAAKTSLAPVSPRGAFGLPFDSLRGETDEAAAFVNAAALVF